MYLHVESGLSTLFLLPGGIGTIVVEVCETNTWNV